MSSNLHDLILQASSKRLLEAIDKRRSELRVAQERFSGEAGLTDTAFAKNLSAAQDISLSRFVAYLAALRRLNDSNLGQAVPDASQIEDCLPDAVLRIADLANSLLYADCQGLSDEEADLLISLVGDVKELTQRKPSLVEAADEYDKLYQHYKESKGGRGNGD
ncbi:MAG: hypothetical protein ACM3PP_00135 [Candidatus Saccharibacteria bacterium]